MTSSRKNYICYIALVLCLVLAPDVSFAQSSESEPSLKEKKTKEGFLIDLKSLITRSKKKIEQANEKINEQELYERNQQREEKAREYYEKGVKLYEKGDYDKAAEYWERAIKISEHPEMKGYIGLSAKKTKKEQKALAEAQKRRLERLEEERGYSLKEVEKTYAKGVAYFKREKYIKAREKFEEVDGMFPDHKATRSYLMLISQKISSQQKEMIAQRLEEDSKEYLENKKNWKKELERKSELRREKLEEQAEAIYNQAVELYKTKQFVAAKERFKEVEWILPDYKSTIKYLKKLDRNIKVDEVLSAEDRQRFFEKQLREERAAGQSSEEFAALRKADRTKEVQKRLEEEAGFVYKSAVALYKKKNYVEAKDMFMEVEEIFPAYKKTRKYLSKIEKKIPEYQRDLLDAKKESDIVAKERDGEVIKKDVIQRREKFTNEAEEKYKKAVSFYGKKNFVEAKIKFIQVEALYPDYKDTRGYLANIDQDISSQLAKGDERAIRGLQVAWQDETQPRTNVPGLQASSSRAPQELAQELSSDDVKVLYKRAVDLYKDDQYESARSVFMRVNEIKPGYKRAEKYLDKIYDKMAKITREDEKLPEKALWSGDPAGAGQFENDAKAIYKEALALYKQKRFVQAREKFVAVNELVPGYKSTKRYILRLNKKVPSIYYEQKEEDRYPQQAAQKEETMKGAETPSILNEEAERAYQEAISFYKRRDFSKARRQFKRVNKLVPDYKLTAVYLTRINRRLGPEAALLESDQGEEEAEDYVSDYDERKLDEKRERKAVTKSETSLIQSFSRQKTETKKQEKIYEKQKQVVAQLKKKERREDLHLYEDKVKALYKEALALYKSKKFEQAKRKFNAIDTMHPDYKSTRHYLTQIERLAIIREEKLRLVKEIEETKALAEKSAAEAAPEEVRGLIDVVKKEQETALRWRLDHEERIAQLMAQDAELERLENEKYEEFRRELDESYENEEKALKESKERINRRVEEIKKEHRRQREAKERAAKAAGIEFERENNKIKVQLSSEPDSSQSVLSKESERTMPKFKTSSDITISRDAAGATSSFKDEIEVTEISESLMRELEALEKTINEQEKMLIRDRQAAQERLQREADRRAQLASKRKYESVTEYIPTKTKSSLASFEERYQQLSEEENEQALERLIRARQRELRHERARIQEQFQDSLDDLYNKAVDLHHAGMYEDARRMFNEVHSMAPGYKKTKTYLTKINETINSRWDPQRSENAYGQKIIDPTPRELQTRDSMVLEALDSFERKY